MKMAFGGLGMDLLAIGRIIVIRPLFAIQTNKPLEKRRKRLVARVRLELTTSAL